MRLITIVAVLILKGYCDDHQVIIVTPSYEINCSTPSGFSNQNSNSTNLDDAMGLLEDKTTILLLQGCHLLNEYQFVTNLSDIAIRGVDNKVIITCALGVGLAFNNITNLSLENVTIEGCGLMGGSTGHLQGALNIVNRTILILYSASPNTNVSILMADIVGLSINKVRVNNNRGIGMLGINVMGDSIMDNVSFTNNTPTECFESSAIETGATAGGMFLLYSDYIITDTVKSSLSHAMLIKNCHFLSNQQCSNAVTIPILLQYNFQDTNGEIYVIGGGAAVGITFAQFEYSVNITISNTAFEDNKGLLGSVLVQQIQGSSGSYVGCNECYFYKNGFQSIAPLSYLRSIGSSATISLNVQPPNSVFYSLSPQLVENLKPNIIEFTNSSFIENTAYIGAGIYFNAFYSPLTTFENEDRISFTNCRFINNTAAVSPAIAAIERKHSGFHPGVQLTLQDITFENNSGLHSSVVEIHDSIVSAVAINVTISNCKFLRNQGSTIFAINSLIHIQDNVTFENNVASSGGALQLYKGSYVVVHNGSYVVFKNNSGNSAGGAVNLISTDTEIIFPECFLWFSRIDFYCNLFNSCIDPGELNIEIMFQGNNAPLGSAVYGTALLDCSWLPNLKNKYNITLNLTSGFEVLNNISAQTGNNFKFELPLSNNRVVNTEALYLRVNGTNGTSDSPIALFPGEMTSVDIIAQDALYQDIPLAVTSHVKGTANLMASSRLGLSGYWFLTGEEEQPPVQAYIYGINNDDNNNGTSVIISVYSVITSASTDVHVELQSCNYGFVFAGNSCVCIPDLGRNHQGFYCNEASGYITIPMFFWLGRSPVSNYTLERCIPGYCHIGNVKFRGEEEIDYQCAENRGGLLCGQCQNGYSIAFGSDRCINCSESNWIVGVLVIVFLLAGIVLVLLIIFLNFTITEGYLNSVIFYSNMLMFFLSGIAQNIGYSSGDIFIIFALINFITGIEICGYDGMNALTRTLLNFMYPFYLLLLMLIIILLARRSKKLTNIGFLATKAIATLLLLCYSSITRTCFIILGRVTIYGNESYYTGWRLDPNVIYGEGLHGFLMFLSISLLLFYIIPFTFILMSPLHFINLTRCGRYLTRKYKPIFDAYYNPFKPKLTFWIGFRCMVRIIPLFISGFTTYPDDAFIIAVLLSIVLLLHEMLQPFKFDLQNRIETYFLINLFLLAIGTLYYPQRADFFDGPTADVYIYVILVALLAYGGLVFVGTIHIHIRFPGILSFLKSCCHRYKKPLKENKSINLSVIGNTIIAPQHVPVTELREPLLEDEGSVELVHVNY